MRALLVDGSNLYKALKDRGLLPVSMRALAEWLTPMGVDTRRFYTAPFRGHGRFLRALEADGWTLRVLRTHKALREEGVDVALAVDLVLLAGHGHKDFVVVSGDGDLAPAVEVARILGARVTVAQFQDLLSRHLVQAADGVVLLDAAPWEALGWQKEVVA